MQNKILAGWIGIGVVGTTIFTSLIGTCLLIPFLGWFVGIPVVCALAMGAGTMWFMVLLVIILVIALPSEIASKMQKT